MFLFRKKFDILTSSTSSYDNLIAHSSFYFFSLDHDAFVYVLYPAVYIPCSYKYKFDQLHFSFTIPGVES